MEIFLVQFITKVYISIKLYYIVYKCDFYIIYKCKFKYVYICNMENLEFYTRLLKDYEKYINLDFSDRYLSFNKLKLYLECDVFKNFKNNIIGYSVNNNPIYNIEVGHGKTKILLWSQMHGNESTTTKSIFDFLNFITLEKQSALVQRLLSTLHISIIPMLNPDGASAYTRHNANLVDLNRDAKNKSQPETLCFFEHLELFDPDFCFNMHGQRTIFSAGEDEYPATVSFLAPSFDHKISLNTSRLKAIKLIGYTNTILQNFIPNQVGRYDEAYNSNCFGDYIQKKNIPTVLYEAGHYQDDYNRNETRKYIFISMLNMFIQIMESQIDNTEKVLYADIPYNKKLYLDCIVKNVKNSSSSWVGIQYKEVLKNDSIVFQPFVSTLNNLSSFYAHLYLDAKGQNIIINKQQQLKQNMRIDELIIDDKLVHFTG